MLRRPIFSAFLTIAIFVFNLQSIHSQDTSRTIVAEGFTHYSISDPSGPFYIQILEVDLTVAGNRLTTALARDKLGTGFEKTSALSTRKSVSGNIVVGAINGDFYGISAPNNPYGFLGNSQIINSEYAFGRTHIRSSFGVIENTKPVVQIINFLGSATAASVTRTITGINSQRGTDALILFNSFFGNSTLTNEFGTEVELLPVDTFTTNSDIRFVASGKQAGVGNMTIQAGKYILSGHGINKTFLDQSVFNGDTITLRFGTSPNLGNVTSLIGGGPRLLINGVKPSTFIGFEGFGADFVETRHPRTAAGYNRDSTIAYFAVVDGRQSLSAGMSLSELADLMLSLGAHNAVNLDGGGSSTMVIHNQVVNSPSDPGGERSVANALFAVREMELSAPAPPNLIYPSNGASNQNDTTILVWSKSQQASVYDLQVSTNPNFSTNVVVNKSVIMDTTYLVTGLSGLQTYYWRIRAKNAVGISQFTQNFNFQTGFPTVPVLIYPPHATMNVSTSPTLIWGKESVAESYRVQLSYGSTIIPANTILDTLIIQDTTLSVIGLDSNRVYYWRVKACNQYGSSPWSGIIGFKTGSPVSVDDSFMLPGSVRIEQNYPNPFNPYTTIRYYTPESGKVKIAVYDLLGTEIITLTDEYKTSGTHEAAFDGTLLSSGIYFYKIIAGSFSSIKKMVLLK